jgi:hypothetical protein
MTATEMTEEERKYEAEIIEVRHYKLGNRLAKERAEIGQGKAPVEVGRVDLSQNQIETKFCKGWGRLIGEIIEMGRVKELNLSYNKMESAALEVLFCSGKSNFQSL